MTELETKLINLIKEDIEWDSKGWFAFWIVEGYSDFGQGDILRGVFSSLVKKGVLEKRVVKLDYGMVSEFRFIK